MRINKLWVRVGLPLLVVAVWIVGAGVGGPYFGKIDEVASNDISTFLPVNAESTKVKEELTKFQTSNTLPVILLFESKSSLSVEQQSNISSVRTAVQNTGVVKGDVSPAVMSEDGKAAFLVIPLDSNSEFAVVIDKLKAAVKDTNVSIDYHFTGPAMFSRDLNSAFAGIDGTLLFVALGVVFFILLIVYRSAILPILTLMSAMVALACAILIVWYLAKNGIVQLNGQVQGILFILVIGAATDYALLYISRYREELVNHDSSLTATKVAWKASWEPIVAAGGTVTLGLLCLLVSDLGSNKALGPVGGIGVILAVLSSLTFLPAALLLFGRTAFWPRMPRYSTSKQAHSYQSNHPVWNKVGNLVSRHPRRLWMGITAALIVCCFFVPQFKAQGVSQTDLIIGYSEAREGQKVLDKHFPGGSGTPLYVLVPKEDQGEVIALLEKESRVDTVSAISSDAKKTSLPVGRYADKIKESVREQVQAQHDAQLAQLRSQLEAQMAGVPQSAIDQAYSNAAANIPTVDELASKINPFAGVLPKVVDNKVALQATLKDPASSPDARETVRRLRTAVQAKYPTVKFGGISAIQLDTNTASEHDLRTIIPLILIVITIVLMLLLRAVVAPIVLLLTTVLSFGATLGIAALLFNHVWQYSGADPSVVIFGFVFLVALGIDYNIFLMTRVREETKKLGVRAGTIKALVVTGGVITSAGIVLASTFGSLYVIPILFLAQIAFIVAFGVMLDALLVRSLLVPSLTLEIGRRMWWPSKLAKRKK